MTRVARSARRAGPRSPARAGSPKPPTGCCRTTSTPKSPRTRSDLVVYGGIGRAARNWACFDAILATLRELDDDESLLVQSGKPVGVFKTHADAPRVLIANSNLVPKWATWEHFNELDRKGLFMYGQMTAGCWIYIGSQGIVQGTYETFAEAGRQHFGGDWRGRWILTAGLGGMGGAQPLAATLAGAVSLDDRMPAVAHRLPPAHPLPRQAGARPRRRAGAGQDSTAHRARRCRSACSAMRPKCCPNSCGARAPAHPRPDLVTDQTSAHDLINGYLPAGLDGRTLA